ncbi:MAG: hypothetical protein ACRCXM_11515 [Beijerinckiaceae bacterium]
MPRADNSIRNELILELFAMGNTKQEIAAGLGLSVWTVRGVISRHDRLWLKRAMRQRVPTDGRIGQRFAWGSR